MQKPVMSPAPGERLMRFVGDRLRFTLRASSGFDGDSGARAFLRTNLGRAARVRQEIIRSYASRLPSAGSAWRDIAMALKDGHWVVELPLIEVGYFQAKAFFIDGAGRQIWPDGPDVGITIHPDHARTGNVIYCAFVRMFGETRTKASTTDDVREKQIVRLEKQGFACIPPSGKLRDLIAQLPHIIDTLGCRIVHLLPVNPTPTTYARFGRFGSPYASLDLTAVDLALAEFDRRVTGIDQFRELTYACHSRGAKVFLDIVTNHTGWGSPLQENHPEWFLREASGKFASPGAWGVTWEDLVELDHRNPASWEHLAEVFVTWCRRGVDGFRCDAGYKVPMPAWRYITACVRQEFPETVFLLEGLGGSWEATESLLTDGGMQWAYSELFQNYSGSEVANYLEYAHRQSQRAGLYVHYSETHDNARLGAQGADWSLLRNRLCGLTSVNGGYGFTCGVEWLATEKIQVHSSRGMNWGSTTNIIPELASLNRLLVEHPCFFDGARLTRLSASEASVYALRRDSEEGRDHVLVLVNTDAKGAREFVLERSVDLELGQPRLDLLGQAPPAVDDSNGAGIVFRLGAAACYCLARSLRPAGLAGDEYRRAKACAAFALQALTECLPVEEVGPFSWRALAEKAESSPENFLGCLAYLDRAAVRQDVLSAIERAAQPAHFPMVVVWELSDATRIRVVPCQQWLLVRDAHPFRVSLTSAAGAPAAHARSVQTRTGYVACFPPQRAARDAQLLLERYTPVQSQVEASIQFVCEKPVLPQLPLQPSREQSQASAPIVLLTNGRGGMARICSDLGRIQSKYDCLLGANLHPAVPVDRHILAKRFRAWITADHFLSPLDRRNLQSFDAGPPAFWRFLANAGDGRTVEVQLHADMLEGRNCTVLRFTRPEASSASSSDLPESCEVRLTVRIDLEDRNFHWETKRNGGAEYHFSSNCRPLRDKAGFEFTPAPDRKLRVYADGGQYHPEPEWCENIPHPVEQSRGQTDRGDAYSPGWFDLPLARGRSITLVLSADAAEPPVQECLGFLQAREKTNASRIELAQLDEEDTLGKRLVLACHQFVVARGEGKTVIAGYPWFLDWGRDTLICVRGLLAAGLSEDVRQMLITFARFEKDGTLPNSIHGEDATNRDTSDAPLWFGVACEEAAEVISAGLYEVRVDANGRTVRDVLRAIAEGYIRGTPNGIRVDSSSGLVWSPSHFTWMDTNYPAGTPREGYPVEIQVLWIRLLRQLARIDAANAGYWEERAGQSVHSLIRLFWLQAHGCLADCIHARPGQPASEGTIDTALRSNYLFAISLGILSGERAQKGVAAALKYLLVPGALRSLAPLPVSPPLALFDPSGRPLNNPNEPYWGRYEGDEDTRRKPAYHNGTAWTWTFPTLCEAVALAWDCSTPAVTTARAYLSSFAPLLFEGCIGHLPEIVDGDTPHLQRGCDAQAWGVTEALRVWKWLQARAPGNRLAHRLP